MSRRGVQMCATVVLAASVVLPWCYAQSRGRSAPRVEPKDFAPGEVSRVFFDDVFSVLVGERPVASAQSSAASPNSEATSGQSSGDQSAAAGSPSGAGWPQYISAATIEDEIKTLKRLVDQDVTTPGEFKGRGYSQCRTHFSVAAMLFGIIQEYEGDVRWKDNAAIARDSFARTAANAKVGTTQVYNEAKLRKADLADLINGSRLASAKPPDPQNDWPAICERAPLMKRLEIALDGEIKKHTARASEFKSNKDRLIRQAEMVAAIAIVLTKPGLEDGDDETYAGYAQQMRDAARQLKEAAEKDDYEAARMSAGIVDQTCSVCHESYRG